MSQRMRNKETVVKFYNEALNNKQPDEAGIAFSPSRKLQRTATRCSRASQAARGQRCARRPA
jgi:hypothetical protein